MAKPRPATKADSNPGAAADGDVIDPRLPIDDTLGLSWWELDDLDPESDLDDYSLDHEGDSDTLKGLREAVEDDDSLWKDRRPVNVWDMFDEADAVVGVTLRLIEEAMADVRQLPIDPNSDPDQESRSAG